MRRTAAWIGFAFLGIAILSIGIWCSLALWFRSGAGGPWRDVIGGAAFAVAVVVTGCLATRWRWPLLLAYAAAVLAIGGWWFTIAPTNDRQWTPDVARTATGTVDGDRLVVENVRNFDWRSADDFDPRWERRAYDLSKITGVDLIMSYWAGEAIAHTILSFGFADGSRLAFSIEIRREENEAYSPLAGFFKQYELAMIAADERDVVRLRSNIRKEDVRIYRLRMTPANARRLLEAYIKEANAIARRPRFYNTLTTNCTTLVFQLVRAIHPTLSLDPRILVSGYLPNYAYDIGATDTDMPFSELRERSRITERALRTGDGADFSAQIRRGLPVPGGSPGGR